MVAPGGPVLEVDATPTRKTIPAGRLGATTAASGTTWVALAALLSAWLKLEIDPHLLALVVGLVGAMGAGFTTALGKAARDHKAAHEAAGETVSFLLRMVAAL